MSAGRRSDPRGSVRKYAEAFELYWIQYVVAYDRQEQRSLASKLSAQQNRVLSPTTFESADDLRARLSSWWKSSSRALNALSSCRLLCDCGGGGGVHLWGFSVYCILWREGQEVAGDATGSH
ncbi:MAG: hypothetical protein WKF84_07735 [Pyrinomonadaceae bacterium]